VEFFDEPKAGRRVRDRRATRVVFAASLSLLAAGVSARDAAGAIRPGFDNRAAASLIGRPTSEFRCPAVPRPLVDMSGYVSRYAPKDPTQSKVDPAREAAVADRERMLKGFARQLAGMADQQLASVPPNPEITGCVWTHLAAWAEAGALMGKVDQNDAVGRRLVIMLGAWQLTTYASVALKVSGPETAEIAAARAKVLPWMKSLALTAMAEARDPNLFTRLKGNQLYWAGVAAAYTSALTQDETLKDLALMALRSGLENVAASGALREEMRRGGRAVMYQQFGTLPLAILVRYADANGVVLTDQERNALVRLVDFSAAAATDTSKVSEVAGVAQEPLNDRSAFAWIDIVRPYVAHIAPDAAARLDRAADAAGARPAWHIYAGGGVTAVYDPTRLRAPQR
jgi:poly(beta-D-mannuronate) lyase